MVRDKRGTEGLKTVRLAIGVMLNGHKCFLVVLSISRRLPLIRVLIEELSNPTRN